MNGWRLLSVLNKTLIIQSFKAFVILDKHNWKLLSQLCNILALSSFDQIIALTLDNSVKANTLAILDKTTIFLAIINRLLHRTLAWLVMTRSNNVHTLGNVLTRFKLNKTLQMTSTLLANLDAKAHISSLAIINSSRERM